MEQSQDNDTPTSDPTPTATPAASPRLRPWYRRRWFMIGAPLALVSLFAAKSFAHGFRGHHRFGAHATPEEMLEHAKDIIAIAGRRLDTTPDQQKKLEALAKERIPALLKHRDEAHALRDKLHEAVSKDDRAALESLRKQGVALADRASSEWLATYTKVADILTPAQRKQLMEHFEHRRHRFGRGGRGGGRGQGHGHGPDDRGQAGRGAL